MLEHSLATLLLVVAVGVCSYKGFRDPSFTERYRFDVDGVLVQKEYYRLLTSGFLHNGWVHLVFNAVALLAFGTVLEPVIGSGRLLLVYFLSLVGGKLLSLFVHKAHAGYTSVGASGAVNGVVYATIALFPGTGIGLFFLPLAIPAWIFGLAYVLFSIYGIKASWGNSNHAAHLGGALVGLLTAVAFYPEAAAANYLPILAIAFPTLAFLALLIVKPEALLVGPFSKKKAVRSIDQEYNYRKAQELADIDNILEKIHRHGLKSLTPKEKEALERYSKTNR